MRTVPISYSGQHEALPAPAATPGREMIRPDVVRAVRLNIKIEREDPYGLFGWPTSVRSDPVHVSSWGQP